MVISTIRAFDIVKLLAPEWHAVKILSIMVLAELIVCSKV